MSDTLTQCHLREVSGDANVIAWIDSHAAKVGNTMKLGDYEGRYEVLKVFDTMDEDYIRERGRDYRNTRKASDV